jgi:hypothetical protein
MAESDAISQETAAVMAPHRVMEAEELIERLPYFPVSKSGWLVVERLKLREDTILDLTRAFPDNGPRISFEHCLFPKRMRLEWPRTCERERAPHLRFQYCDGGSLEVVGDVYSLVETSSFIEGWFGSAGAVYLLDGTKFQKELVLKGQYELSFRRASVGRLVLYASDKRPKQAPDFSLSDHDLPDTCGDRVDGGPDEFGRVSSADLSLTVGTIVTPSVAIARLYRYWLPDVPIIFTGLSEEL